MKKILVVLLLVGLACSAPALNWGIKAGASMGFVDYESAGVKGLIGYMGGVFLEFPLGKVFTLQVDGLFHRYRGAAEDGGTLKIRDMQLEIPVVFKYSIPLGGNKLAFMAGGSVACGFNPQVDEGSSGWEDIKDDEWYKVVGSIVVGVSLDIRKFLIDLRFSYGLNDRLEGGSELTMNAISLTVGMRL